MKILCCSVCYGSSSCCCAFWALGVDYFLNIHTETRCADRLGGEREGDYRDCRRLDQAFAQMYESD